MLQPSWVRRYAPGSSIFVFPAATVRGFVRGLEGGWDMEQTVAFARALESRGCDAIHVSSGGLHPARRIPASPRYQANRRLTRHPLTHFSIPPSIFARVRQGLRLGLGTFRCQGQIEMSGCGLNRNVGFWGWFEVGFFWGGVQDSSLSVRSGFHTEPTRVPVCPDYARRVAGAPVVHGRPAGGRLSRSGRWPAVGNRSASAGPRHRGWPESDAGTRPAGGHQT